MSKHQASAQEQTLKKLLNEFVSGPFSPLTSSRALRVGASPEPIPHLTWYIYTLLSLDVILPSWLLYFVLFPLESCELPGSSFGALAAFSITSPPPTTTPAQQRTKSPRGTVKAQSTHNPQVDTLVQRERLRGGGTKGSLTWDTDSCPLARAALLYPAQLLCQCKAG